jgi:hypothetical protein
MVVYQLSNAICGTYIDEPVSALGRDELDTADYVSHA